MGISNPVNEEFAKIFMQLHYMEQSGKGVPTVVAKYGKEVYRFGTSFTLTDIYADEGIIYGEQKLEI